MSRWQSARSPGRLSKPSESLALHWLALFLTPRLGPTRARRLVEHFGGVQNIFKASLTELEATGIQTVSVQSLGTGQSMELAQDELGCVAAAGVTVVCQGDSTYPAQLKQIYDPPLVLYVCGNVDAIAQPGIAVVGTRHPAVFGTGVDIVYPKEKSRLTDQMLSLGGALISECPMNTFAAPQNFPIRSRIISGISTGVLVVEAAEYTGTRITSRCALEQNREVFAVPGNVTNKNSWGPNT